MRLDDGEKAPRHVEIVGVVGDVRHLGLEKKATFEVYVSEGTRVGELEEPRPLRGSRTTMSASPGSRLHRMAWSGVGC